MVLDGAGCIDDRWQSSVGSPEVPSLEEAGARRGGGLIIEVLEGEPDLRVRPETS